MKLTKKDRAALAILDDVDLPLSGRVTMSFHWRRKAWEVRIARGTAPRSWAYWILRGSVPRWHVASFPSAEAAINAAMIQIRGA